MQGARGSFEKKIWYTSQKMKVPNFYKDVATKKDVVNKKEIVELLDLWEITEMIEDFYELEAKIDTILEENPHVNNLDTVLYRMLAFALQNE